MREAPVFRCAHAGVVSRGRCGWQEQKGLWGPMSSATQHEDVALEEPNPAATIFGIAGGYWVSRCLHMVNDLKIADALDELPRTAEELAADVGANADALGRIMRLLAAHGIFEAYGGAFRHSPASRLLRSDHPRSMRSFVSVFDSALTFAGLDALEHPARTGRPRKEGNAPDGHWAYVAARPELSRLFNEAMAAKAHAEVAGVLGAYDFSGFRTIGDIGGGSGHLLRAVLDAAPEAKGVLFDLPHVIEDVKAIASPRLELMAGDFFRDELPACDAYLLMDIIHDWADAESLAILGAVRQAAPPQARVLLIELIVPDDPGPDWSKVLDVHMLALLGGRQRTLQEFESLLNQTDFRLIRQITTPVGVSIVEAEAV